MITIDNIFHLYIPEYISKYWDKMPTGHKKTIQDILSCRTRKLGGQTWYCENCQKIHYNYFSCKNRMCPKCQNNQTTTWLSKQMKKLLPVQYFMVTFTVPSELRDIFRSNNKICYELLFKASSESMKQLALDRRFIGGEIGMVGLLQTWTSNLIYHPHIHYIVPGIALSKHNNTIKFAKNKFLFHNKPLAKLYRGKLCAGLKENNLNVPQEIWAKNWVVDIQAVGNGIGSLKYLSKYIYKTAISNNNILSSENKTVTIRIKDNQTRKNKIISLPAMEFIRRFLQHTLPKGFQKVRSYGLLHPKRKSTLYLLQILLKTQIKENCIPKNPIFKCPKCGKKMILIDTTKRNRAPPLIELLPQISNITGIIHQSSFLYGS